MELSTSWPYPLLLLQNRVSFAIANENGTERLQDYRDTNEGKRIIDIRKVLSRLVYLGRSRLVAPCGSSRSRARRKVTKS